MHPESKCFLILYDRKELIKNSNAVISLLVRERNSWGRKGYLNIEAFEYLLVETVLALSTILKSGKTASLSPHHAGRSKKPDTAVMFLLVKHNELVREWPNMDLPNMKPRPTVMDKWMQCWMYYKSLKTFALPVCKCNTHSHYVHLQDGKFEAFPFNFNLFPL